jgi:hypothetical protein
MDTTTIRTELKNLWETEDPFKCFPWETVKRVASNPEIKSLDNLREILHKIVSNRKEK